MKKYILPLLLIGVIVGCKDGGNDDVKTEPKDPLLNSVDTFVLNVINSETPVFYVETYSPKDCKYINITYPSLEIDITYWPQIDYEQQENIYFDCIIKSGQSVKWCQFGWGGKTNSSDTLIKTITTLSRNHFQNK